MRKRYKHDKTYHSASRSLIGYYCPYIPRTPSSSLLVSQSAPPVSHPATEYLTSLWLETRGIRNSEGKCLLHLYTSESCKRIFMSDSRSRNLITLKVQPYTLKRSRGRGSGFTRWLCCLQGWGWNSGSLGHARQILPYSLISYSWLERKVSSTRSGILVIPDPRS